LTSYGSRKAERIRLDLAAGWELPFGDVPCELDPRVIRALERAFGGWPTVDHTLRRLATWTAKPPNWVGDRKADAFMRIGYCVVPAIWRGEALFGTVFLRPNKRDRRQAHARAAAAKGTT
jgi:hypothetical protein